jgi:hypothetical protein
MKWRYSVTWIDGRQEVWVSSRHSRPTAEGLTIYLNEHGHDRRFDEIHIPLDSVRTVFTEEVR